MIPINHLRARIDSLSWRIEQAREEGDVRRLVQECIELEQAIRLHEARRTGKAAEMKAAKVQLHRLKARI